MSTPLPRPAPVMNQTLLSVIGISFMCGVRVFVWVIQPPAIAVGKARVIGVLRMPPYRHRRGVGWTRHEQRRRDPPVPDDASRQAVARARRRAEVRSEATGAGAPARGGR